MAPVGAQQWFVPFIVVYDDVYKGGFSTQVRGAKTHAGIDLSFSQ